MTKFNYVSLFSGVGGFEQALNKLGGNCVFASEIDKFASKAYETLYGGKPYGDIKEIRAQDIPDHDLLVGGFPCQAFSVAGNRGGFDDTRGTLFFEVARIASEKQPSALLLENVKGLVGHDKGKTLDTIVKTLNDIGYRVDFEVLNSKYFGVPQNRERIFILAVRDDLIDNEPWSNTKGTTVVPKGKRRISGYEDIKSFNFDWPKHEEVTTRLRDILEHEVDEKYYLSDDKTAKLVSQLEENDLELPKETDGINKAPNETSYCITTRTHANYSFRGAIEKKQATMIVEKPQMLGHVDIRGNDSIKRVYSAESVGPTLTTMGGGHREPKIAEEQDPKIENPLKGKTEYGWHFEQKEGSRYRIRKLTPLECFRLQGFPDEAHQALVDEGISDSQRYKMAGNAVTVNVIEAIGERLLLLI